MRNETIDAMLQEEITTNTSLWHKILERLLHAVFFLAERGLPFRGDSEVIGDKSNGLFLGLLEVIARYDPVLKAHLAKVRQSQLSEKREQVHYLSPQSQNEFIFECSEILKGKILNEINESKYYSIIIDSTPDTSHKEQTAFIFRYLREAKKDSVSYRVFGIEERFLAFVDFVKKKGEDIANMTLCKLSEWGIPFSNCRGQGYDNGSNMSGIHNGVQAVLLRENKFAIYMYSPCACHTLNLCGSNAAQCCAEVMTYFGMVQKLFTFFSASPQRWEILQDKLKCSLHSQSGTRWSERVDAVRPVAAHSGFVIEALEAASSLSLVPEAFTELQALQKYFSSFVSILMSSIWVKVLTSIDQRNRILQARRATIDAEVQNLNDLLSELKSLREKWTEILKEATLVAECLGIVSHLPEKRLLTRNRFYEDADSIIESSPATFNSADEESTATTNFRINVFYRLIDAALQGLTCRFEAIKRIDDQFGFLYKYRSMNDTELKLCCERFCEAYCEDISCELTEEVLMLSSTGDVNLGISTQLPPLELLNKLHECHLDALFPNICVCLRIFCTLPVSVASAERSFSQLKRIKNYARSTMTQERLQGLSLLCIESELARTVNYEAVIQSFARRKSRKAPI